MSVPTSGETFAKLIERLRLAQEDAAMLAHLEKANGYDLTAKGWLAVSEMLKLTQHNVTRLAKRGLRSKRGIQ